MKRKHLIFVIIASIAMLSAGFASLTGVLIQSEDRNITIATTGAQSTIESAYDQGNSQSNIQALARTMVESAFENTGVSLANNSLAFSLDYGFVAWYLSTHGGAQKGLSSLKSTSGNAVNSDFVSYLEFNVSAKKVLKALIADEQTYYESQNRAVGQNFINAIENNSSSGVPSSEILGHSQYYFIAASSDDYPLPPGVRGNTYGAYAMVSINPEYYWVPVWIGIGFIVVWEQIASVDDINQIFLGPDANNFYNFERTHLDTIGSDLQLLYFGFAGALTFPLVAKSLAATLGKLAGIVSLVLAAEGVALGLWVDSVGNNLYNVYDSTFTGEMLKGNIGYLWTVNEVVDGWGYFYILGLGDGVSVYAYYSDHSTQNIVPYLPVPVVEQIVAVNWHSWAEALANQLGGSGIWGSNGRFQPVQSIGFSASSTHINTGNSVTFSATTYDSTGDAIDYSSVQVVDSVSGHTYVSGSTDSNGVYSTSVTFNSAGQYTLKAVDGSVDSSGITITVVSPPPPPPPSGGCILNGTLVSVAWDKTVPVQDLAVGGEILSYDPARGNFIQNTITSINITRNVSSILNIDNGLLYVSGMTEQPIYVLLPNGTAEWIMIGQLNTSDFILNPITGMWVPVFSLQIDHGNFTVYEINGKKIFYQDGYMRFTYIANGFLLDRKIGA